jgi:hypothetical protein
MLNFYIVEEWNNAVIVTVKHHFLSSYIFVFLKKISRKKLQKNKEKMV